MNSDDVKPIDLMDPTLTLERLEELKLQQMEAQDEELARKFAVEFYAMLIGTLHEGELTPRSCILISRVNRALKRLKDFANGKIKRLPEKLW